MDTTGSKGAGSWGGVDWELPDWPSSTTDTCNENGWRREEAGGNGVEEGVAGTRGGEEGGTGVTDLAVMAVRGRGGARNELPDQRLRGVVMAAGRRRRRDEGREEREEGVGDLGRGRCFCFYQMETEIRKDRRERKDRKRESGEIFYI